jgi:23S rRNA maturation mini-RNase III
MLRFYSNQGVRVRQCLNTGMHTPVSGTHVLRQASSLLTVLTSDLKRGLKCLSKVGSTAQCHRMQKNTPSLIIYVHVASLFTCFLGYFRLMEQTDTSSEI